MQLGRNRLPLLGLTVIWLGVGTGFGQSPAPQSNPATNKDPAAGSNPFSLDLDSLFNTKVTTAAKFSQKLSDAPGVVSVVTKDEIARFGGITLAEILQRVSGLNATTGFFGDRSMVAVRGDQTRSDQGHILMLINGRPVREVMEGGISSDMMESFPVNILERIEVVKGPGSVLYGSDAYSGVINLITRKADGREVHVRGGAGGAGAAAASEEAFYQRGALNIVQGGQYHRLPQWDVLFLSAPHPPNLNYSQNATLRNEGTGGYLGLNYKGFSFMSSYTGFENSTFVRGIVGDARWKRGFTDLGYSLHAMSKWEMQFNVTYSRSLLDAPDYPLVHRDSDESVAEWTNFITFSEKDKLIFGTVFNHIRGTETFYGPKPPLIDAQGQRSGTGFYVQHEHKLTGDLKLIAGLQANKIGKLDLSVVPRGGILWNPAAHWTLKALYGGAFRAPSLDETLINHPGLKGDPNLVPEKVGTFDVQASYENNRVQMSADYFHSRQTHLIFQDGSTLPAHYYNFGTGVTFQGAEGEGKFYVHRNWFVTGSLLYQANHDGTGRANLTPIPALSAKAGVSYQRHNGLDLSLFDAYQGHIPGYAGTSNQRPDASHSVNLHARYDLSPHLFKNDNRGLALYAHAENLVGQQVWLPAIGSNSQNTIPFVQGRTAYFGVEVWQK